MQCRQRHEPTKIVPFKYRHTVCQVRRYLSSLFYGRILQLLAMSGSNAGLETGSEYLYYNIGIGVRITKKPSSACTARMYSSRSLIPHTKTMRDESRRPRIRYVPLSQIRR